MKLREAPDLEKHIGIRYYVTLHDGTGGTFRSRLEDFIVIEDITLNVRSSGRYPCLLCFKRGIDTFHALKILSSVTGVSITNIGYAGLKDAQAYTLQYMTLKTSINIPFNVIRMNNVIFKLVGYTNSMLKPGDVKCNKFIITVRNVRKNYHKLLKAILDEIKVLGGIPSFYGHQRFGTRRPNTHKVGEYIVKRMWREAVDEIIGKPYPYESENSKIAREVYDKTHDAKLTLKYMPKSLVYERRILKSLSKNPNDCLKALKTLPKMILRLYVEAYQSYIYNLILSKRLEHDIPPLGFMRGDLIARGDKVEVASGKGMLRGDEKVLIPVPGFAVREPSGEFGDLYRSVLKDENVKHEMFKVKEIKGVGSKGFLRETPMRVYDLKFKPIDNTSYRLTFRLDKGMYATILLREIVKGNPIEY